jgi:eukaryotic-like serine/threonine-protein kinase
MGVVNNAENTKLKRTVALKFLPLELTSNPEAKARFIHEAQEASTLDHPNICTIYEIFETDDGQLFIAMAWYEGLTLKRKIVRAQSTVPFPDGSTIPVDQAIAIQIAEGLVQPHEEGIIRLDNKPATIIITDRDKVKILDFGPANLTSPRK